MTLFKTIANTAADVDAIGTITLWSVGGAVDVAAFRSALSDRGLIELVDSVNPTSPMNTFHAVVSRYQKRQYVRGAGSRTGIISPLLRNRGDIATYSINIAVGTAITENDLMQVGAISYDAAVDKLEITTVNLPSMTEEDYAYRAEITEAIANQFEAETRRMSAVDMNAMLNAVVLNLPGATKLVRNRQDWFIPDLGDSIETLRNLFAALRASGTPVSDFHFPVLNTPEYTTQVASAVTADITEVLGDLRDEFDVKVENRGKRKLREDYVTRFFNTLDDCEYRLEIYGKILPTEFKAAKQAEIDALRDRGDAVRG